MSTKIDTAFINKLALKVDKEKGNGNKAIDTDDELSIFTEQLEKKGVSNAKDIVNDYKTNSLKYEAGFMKNGTTVGSNINYAIYKAINPKSSLVKNENINEEVNDIVDNIYDAVTGWTFLHIGTKEDKLEENVNKIDKDNVLKVMDKYNSAKGESLAAAIVGDTSGELLNRLGETLIDALYEKAKSIGVNVSDIIVKDNSGFTVVNVDGAASGESATNDDNLEKVVNALKNRIENALSLYAGDDDGKKLAKENPEETMMLLAHQADTNGDGDIKDDEVGLFKKLCANAGISINQMILNMDKKDENNYTTQEQTLHNIFSSNINEVAATNTAKTSLAAKVTNGINSKDKSVLDEIFTTENINADTVEEFLTTLEKNDDFMKLPVNKRVTLVHDGRVSYKYSDNNDIGNKLVTKFGDDSQKYTSVIVKALIDKANENDIDVRDIVRFSNGNFYTGKEIGSTGKDALDKEYVNDVINKLRERIKEENDLSDITLD